MAKHTPETRAKIAAASAARWRDPEFRARQTYGYRRDAGGRVSWAEAARLRVRPGRSGSRQQKTPVAAAPPPGTVGAAAELRVAADLLAQGFEIFRSLSPACSCDLVALKDGKLFRVEVKTAVRSKHDGHIYEPANDPTKWDVLALVLPDGIVYRSRFSPDSSRLNMPEVAHA